MQRKTFRITSSVGHNTVKTAWNSSCREVEKMIRQIARNVDSEYILTDSVSLKDGSGNHYKGSRSWTNQKNKSTIVFTINQETCFEM